MHTYMHTYMHAYRHEYIHTYIHAYMHAYIQTDESLEELSLINVVLNVDAEQEVEEG